MAQQPSEFSPNLPYGDLPGTSGQMQPQAPVRERQNQPTGPGPGFYGPSVRRPDAPPPIRPEELVFQHRYPRLDELLQDGGLPGVSYMHGWIGNEQNFARMPEPRGPWSPIENLPSYVVIGPNGSCDVRLYGKGKPIPGCPAGNGRRHIAVDVYVEESTGLYLNGPPTLQRMDGTSAVSEAQRAAVAGPVKPGPKPGSGSASKPRPQEQPSEEAKRVSEERSAQDR